MLECNQALARMYGFESPDDLAGVPLRSFLDPADPSNLEYMRTFFRSGLRLEDGESHERDRDGQPRIFLNNLIGVVDVEDGGLALVWGTQREVTETRRLEARLRQNEKLEAVALLATGVAHDFRNMLQSIQGHLELLREAVGGDPELREMLDDICHTADNAEALTQQLLAIGRIDPARRRRVDLNTFVAGALSAKTRILPQGVVLESRISSAPLWVLGDPAALEQAVVNLVVNACDAMPEGGTLTIRTALAVEADERGEVASRAVLEVRDTGAGIPDEVRARIFEPYFTTKPGAKGTGLGLVQVHRAVSASEGTIDVESAPGRGTCFRVSLPLAPSEPAP
jgi:signal transduction histidine kinase